MTAWAKAQEDPPQGVNFDAEPKLPVLSPDQIDAEGQRSGSLGGVKISKTSKRRKTGITGAIAEEKGTYDLDSQMEGAREVKESEFATASIRAWSRPPPIHPRPPGSWTMRRGRPVRIWRLSHVLAISVGDQMFVAMLGRMKTRSEAI